MENEVSDIAHHVAHDWGERPVPVYTAFWLAAPSQGSTGDNRFGLPLAPSSEYDRSMTIPQCKAIVIYGRDAKGNRSGLIPPRQCLRPATDGDYCGLHARQAELQDLLRSCLAYDWEWKVKAWRDRKHRERVAEGRRVARGMESCARQLKLTKLALFLRMNDNRVAESWAEVSS